jgi:hypothetical protein
MKRMLLIVITVIVVVAGYSLCWRRASKPREAAPSLAVQEISASEAAHRHMLDQPRHWRALLLRQQY